MGEKLIKFTTVREDTSRTILINYCQAPRILHQIFNFWNIAFDIRRKTIRNNQHFILFFLL